MYYTAVPVGSEARTEVK